MRTPKSSLSAPDWVVHAGPNPVFRIPLAQAIALDQEHGKVSTSRTLTGCVHVHVYHTSDGQVHAHRGRVYIRLAPVCEITW
jgi:hypothetical protein